MTSKDYQPPCQSRLTAHASWYAPVSPLTGSRLLCDALIEAEPRQVLRSFTARFAHVFFTPGNHDLWVRRQERGQYDSIGELTCMPCLMV